MLLKPRYPKLNYNHPLAKGSIFALPLNEGGGGLVFDKAQSRVIGNMTSPAMWSAGPFGPRLTFNGAQGITLAPTVTLPTVFTVAFWIQPASGNSAYSNCLTQANTRGWWYNGTSNKIDFYNGADHFNNTALSVGNNYLYVCTCDGTTTKFYLNGQSDGSAAATFPGGLSLSRIGADNGSAGIGETFTGSLDGYLIWDRCLTASEVRQLYPDSFAPYRLQRRFPWLNSASGGGTTLTIVKAALTLAGSAIKAAEALSIVKAGLVLAGNSANAAVALKPTKASLTLSGGATSAATALRITKAALTLSGKAVTYSAAAAITVLAGALVLRAAGAAIGGRGFLQYLYWVIGW